ncbi:hypothetical protein [Ferrovibrio sp.]|uniref:hypothetical protein n=1 Tax=Ferrovibrio sp. TaxID=1917215 RepID=UPI0025C5808C|nr:hypothetical protein [Ferrovibrio sp.]MBX3456526.1 hypothetical protein [Ferrovibrio sp.]
MFLTFLVVIHTLVSFISIFLGMIVLSDLLRSEARPQLSGWFFATALFTSLSGFAFPAAAFLPSHGVAIVALLVLALTLPARYRFGMLGIWRVIYAGGVVASVYLLLFVLMAQMFTRIPGLNALAPTLAEPPFAIAQGLLLLVSAGFGLLAIRRFRPA